MIFDRLAMNSPVIQAVLSSPRVIAVVGHIHFDHHSPILQGDEEEDELDDLESPPPEEDCPATTTKKRNHKAQPCQGKILSTDATKLTTIFSTIQVLKFSPNPITIPQNGVVLSFDDENNTVVKMMALDCIGTSEILHKKRYFCSKCAKAYEALQKESRKSKSLITHALAALQEAIVAVTNKASSVVGIPVVVEEDELILGDEEEGKVEDAVVPMATDHAPVVIDSYLVHMQASVTTLLHNRQDSWRQEPSHDDKEFELMKVISPDDNDRELWDMTEEELLAFIGDDHTTVGNNGSAGEDMEIDGQEEENDTIFMSEDDLRAFGTTGLSTGEGIMDVDGQEEEKVAMYMSEEDLSTYVGDETIGTPTGGEVGDVNDPWLLSSTVSSQASKFTKLFDPLADRLCWTPASNFKQDTSVPLQTQHQSNIISRSITILKDVTTRIAQLTAFKRPNAPLSKTTTDTMADFFASWGQKKYEQFLRVFPLTSTKHARQIIAQRSGGIFMGIYLDGLASFTSQLFQICDRMRKEGKTDEECDHVFALYNCMDESKARVALSVDFNANKSVDGLIQSDNMLHVFQSNALADDSSQALSQRLATGVNVTMVIAPGAGGSTAKTVGAVLPCGILTASFVMAQDTNVVVQECCYGAIPLASFNDAASNNKKFAGMRNSMGPITGPNDPPLLTDVNDNVCGPHPIFGTIGIMYHVLFDFVHLWKVRFFLMNSLLYDGLTSLSIHYYFMILIYCRHGVTGWVPYRQVHGNLICGTHRRKSMSLLYGNNWKPYILPIIMIPCVISSKNVVLHLTCGKQCMKIQQK